MKLYVKTVMADQNDFVAVSKKEIESQAHVKSIITAEGFIEIKEEPQKTKEFPNISTQKHSYSSGPNSGEPNAASKSNPQFGFECKRNMGDAKDVLDLSLRQSTQRIDAEGTSKKVNILNTSINDIQKEEKVLELKEDKPQIQCPQGSGNNAAAIDLSLRKDKKEVRKDTATEETESTNASWQNKNVKDPVALGLAIKTELEEGKGRNQYSKEIPPKYEYNPVSLIENPLALQKSFQCVKASREKGSLMENSVALNELIIKSENSYTQDNNQEHFSQRNLYDNSYNHDLNTSLDVNIDTLSKRGDKDSNDEPSIQSCSENANNSEFSLNKTTSEEVSNESSSLKRNSLTEKKKKMKSKGNPLRIPRKPYKTRQKTSLSNTNLKEPIRKTSKRGRKPKTKQSSNCIEKDSAFITGFLIKKRIKNLPKTTTIETRIKEKNNKRIAAKEEVPKPFKLENIAPELHGIATRLPKPITFKQEFQIDIRNTELYKQSTFQPFVRLKRLSSEDLLIPLKTKRVRKSRSEDTSIAGRRLNSCYQTTNNDNKDLIIHQAFSLNPRIKLKQLSGNHDHSYDQSSLDSSMTTPLSATNDNNSHVWNDSESKYVNSQELLSPFHHAIPKHGSVISGNTDSGVSTSTPITLPHRYDTNIRLLLEIAAERAFINNHLKEFGYSPIQFQLYNDFNELNIFLKYLIDKNRY